jgi:hypothetical protein
MSGDDLELTWRGTQVADASAKSSIGRKPTILIRLAMLEVIASQAVTSSKSAFAFTFQDP